MGADTKANTSGAAAHLRLVRVLLLFSASHSALMPSAVQVPLPFGQMTQIWVSARLTNAKGVLMGADTKANTSGAFGHLKMLIFVLLRMAASAVAPLTPISLPLRLRARDRMGHCERAGNGC